MTQPTQAQITALKDLLPGYEQYLEWCVERGVLFVKNGRENLEKAKEAIAALTAAAAAEVGDYTLADKRNDKIERLRFAVEEYKKIIKRLAAAAEVGDNATIERCAQVAENFEWGKDDDNSTLAAAIRALKD